jgi:hygromycin-B 7''-O-kinase
MPELQRVAADALGGPHAMEWLSGSRHRTAVFTVGERAVLKTYFHAAERKWARESFAYEFLGASGLPIARKIAAGRLADGTPWLLFERLPGRVLADCAEVPIPERRVLWQRLGAMLARLHAGEWAPGAPTDRADVRRNYEQKIARNVEEYAAEIERTPTLAARMAPVLAYARRHAAAFAVRSFAFVHGDFSARNVLIDGAADAWRVTGLIDFEKAEFGDPAVDVASMTNADWAGRRPLLREFVTSYAEHGGTIVRDRVAFYVAYIAIDAALWAPQEDPAYFERVLAVTRAALDDPEGLWAEA